MSKKHFNRVEVVGYCTLVDDEGTANDEKTPINEVKTKEQFNNFFDLFQAEINAFNATQPNRAQRRRK